MRTNLIILTVIILLTGLSTLFVSKRQPSQNSDANLGAAPDFAYKTIHDDSGNFYDHKGTVILLHFWATWCPPCIVEFPKLLDLADRKNKDFIIIAVTADKEKADIKQFYKKLDRPIPDNFITVWDRDKVITHGLYEAMKIPESFLIGHDMTIGEKITGPQDNWNSPRWHQKIENLSVRKSVNK